MIAGDEEEVLWVAAVAASFQRTSCGLRRAYCSSATSDFSADHLSALPGVMTSPVKKSEKKKMVRKISSSWNLMWPSIFAVFHDNTSLKTVE